MSRNVKCSACEKPVPEIDWVLMLNRKGDDLVVDFHCSMVLLHTAGMNPDTKVVVFIELLRRIRDREVEGA